MCCLSSLATDSSGQLNVLGHNGDPLGVDGAEVGVFEQSDQVGLAGFLQSHHGGALEAQVSLEVLGDLTHKALEGELANEQFCGFLVAPDLTESDCSRLVAVRLLDTSGGRGTLAGSLGGQLFPGSLASGRLASGLLGTSHEPLLSCEIAGNGSNGNYPQFCTLRANYSEHCGWSDLEQFDWFIYAQCDWSTTNIQIDPLRLTRP